MLMFQVGTGVAAERGILLKGADVLETVRKARLSLDASSRVLTRKSSSVRGIYFVWSNQFIKNTGSSMTREYL